MAQSPKSPTGNPGFTLTELLVVLAIMALVIALAPPMLNAGRHGAQARWAALTLATRLEAARAQALNTQQTVAFALPDGQNVDFYPDGSATGITDHGKNFTIFIAPISGRVSVSE